jgi:hypothetical protein
VVRIIDKDWIKLENLIESHKEDLTELTNKINTLEARISTLKKKITEDAREEVANKKDPTISVQQKEVLEVITNWFNMAPTNFIKNLKII